VAVLFEAADVTPGSCFQGEPRTLTLSVKDPQGDLVIGTPITRDFFCGSGGGNANIPVVYTLDNCPTPGGPATGAELGEVEIVVEVDLPGGFPDDSATDTRFIRCNAN
jgi:hypothetical protein